VVVATLGCAPAIAIALATVLVFAALVHIGSGAAQSRAPWLR
jgi:hypothetical protein